MKNEKEYNELEKMLNQTIMIGMGIVPIENLNTDVSGALEASSKEDARVMKRKFRKLWRKAAKKTNVFGSASVGQVGKVPSKQQKLNRKKIVKDEVMNEKVTPMLDNFKSKKEQTK